MEKALQECYSKWSWEDTEEVELMHFEAVSQILRMFAELS